jgi:hypothetical protein
VAVIFIFLQRFKPFELVLVEDDRQRNPHRHTEQDVKRSEKERRVTEDLTEYQQGQADGGLDGQAEQCHRSPTLIGVMVNSHRCFSRTLT